MESGQTSDSIAHGWQPIGAHHVKIQLKAGEQKKIIFLLGYQENPADDKFDPPGSQTINKRTVKPVIARYLQIGAGGAGFRGAAELLGRLAGQAAGDHARRAHQSHGQHLERLPGDGHLQLLALGLLFRDRASGAAWASAIPTRTCWASCTCSPSAPALRILDLAATQLPNGGAYHQYQPLTKRGNNDIGSDFNDDPLWLVLAVAAYLKETGDWSILDEPVPYDNQPGTEESRCTSTCSARSATRSTGSARTGCR